MKIHFVQDEHSIKTLKLKIREMLLKTGLSEHDNRFGRIMERVSFLESDDINLLHSIGNLLSDPGKDELSK